MLPDGNLAKHRLNIESVGRSAPRKSATAWIILSDVLACSAAWFLAGYTVTLVFGEPHLLAQEFRRWQIEGINPLLIHVLMAAGILFVLDRSGHYRIRLPFFLEVKQLALGALWGLLLEALIYYSLPFDFSRPWLFVAWAYTFAFVLIGRIVVKKGLMMARMWEIPTLVVGDREMAETVCSLLHGEPQLGYAVTSTIDFHDSSAESRQSSTDWANRVISRYISDNAHHIILALPHSPHAGWEKLLRVLNICQIPYAVMPQIRELSVLELDIVPFYRNDGVLLSPRHRLANPFSAATKRVFDLTFSVLALVAIAPLFVMVATAIRLDGGPAFFRHRRVGRDGKEFDCLKFRTMRPNAEQVLAQILAADPEMAAEWSASQKLKDDPRVTKIGRLLRKYSFDELPQLINVILGDMSLVGPRPVTRGELREHYGEHAYYYHATRPGITGVWQVSGRSDTSYSQRVSFDGWYVRNWSLWHDLAILFQTVPVLLFQRGAY